MLCQIQFLKCCWSNSRCLLLPWWFNQCVCVLIIIIITTTMFIVLSSWHSHCESSPGSFDECRLSAGWPPTLRPNKPIWAVSPPKDWLLPSADTIAIYYYYSARKLILILLRSGIAAKLTVTVIVTEALVLHPRLEDRGHVTESICILVPIDRMKQKCFQITTKQSRLW